MGVIEQLLASVTTVVNLDVMNPTRPLRVHEPAEVDFTAATWGDSFVQAVASTSRRKKLPFGAAVEGTDRSSDQPKV